MTTYGTTPLAFPSTLLQPGERVSLTTEPLYGRPERLLFHVEPRVRGPLPLLRWRLLPDARGTMLMSISYGMPEGHSTLVPEDCRARIDVWNAGWAPNWVHASVLMRTVSP